MSTEFATLLRIRASDLLDGRLERFGVCEDVMTVEWSSEG